MLYSFKTQHCIFCQNHIILFCLLQSRILCFTLRPLQSRIFSLFRHKGQRDYKCGVCDFYGYTFTDIRKHIERKHAATIRCDKCGSTFRNEIQLRVSMIHWGGARDARHSLSPVFSLPTHVVCERLSAMQGLPEYGMAKFVLILPRIQWRIQDFSEVGAPTLGRGVGGASIRFCQIFPKNCMKLKEFGPPGDTCPSHPP